MEAPKAGHEEEKQADAVAPTTACSQRMALNLLRNNEAFAILTSEHPICSLVASEGFALGIKGQGLPHAIFCLVQWDAIVLQMLHHSLKGLLRSFVALIGTALEWHLFAQAIANIA